MIRPGPVWLAACLVLAAATLAAAADRAASKAEIGRLERRERGVIAQLDALDRQLMELKARQRELAAEARESGRELAGERKRLQELSRREGLTKSRLRERLKALRLHGEEGLVRLLLAAPTAAEAIFGWQVLARLVSFDLQLIKDYNALKTEFAQAEERHRARQARAQSLGAELKRAEAELEEQRRRRARILLDLEERKQGHQEALAELDQAAEEFDQGLTSMGRGAVPAATGAPAETSVPAGRMEPLRGRLPWPVAGTLGQVPGQKRPGVLIQAREGEPVKAVADGQAGFAGWVKGYGQVVVIDHGGGYYTVSGHLEDVGVTPGQAIRAGQVIGAAGRAGLSRPGVYFEIRHRNQALDPRRWLATAAR